MSNSSNALASTETTDRVVDSSNEPSLSWRCGFPPCTKLRVYEGGSRFGPLERCSICDSSVAVDSRHQEAIIAAIDQHLL
jgi:hypothetical protein